MQQTPHAPFEQARSLEAFLGDPHDGSNVFSFPRAVRLDEAEAYPDEGCRRLDAWGLQRYYVPARWGGQLRSFEEALLLLRLVARRDLSLAVSHAGSFLGAVAAWIDGTPVQQKELAARILSGERVAFALSEAEHGADVLSNETEARRRGSAYLLSGEKWPIGNAGRAGSFMVFARTNPRGGPRGFSLFLVSKDQLPPTGVEVLPRVPTHGLRAAELSGLRFSGCEIPERCRVGQEGHGLELTLKGLQVTRTLVPGLALGAADPALRTVVAFARERRLYGAALIDLPYARRLLAEAYVDVLACEVLATAAARALHTVPGQMSLWSAVAKYFIPSVLEPAVRSLGMLYGARAYLRDGHGWGAFQKVVRDIAVTGLFDGSSTVNLHAIALQAGSLGRARASAEATATWADRTFRLDRPLPDFEWDALDFVSHDRDDLLLGVAERAQEYRASRTLVPSWLRETLDELVRRLGARVQAHHDAAARAAADYRPGPSVPPALFDLAAERCSLHVAACCLHAWLYNWGSYDAPRAAAWLLLALGRLLAPDEVRTTPAFARCVDSMMDALLEQFADGVLFSLHRVVLAEAARPSGGAGS